MENESLVLDLVSWMAGASRDYEDVMAAWRTSCPRLSIWEDTLAAGLLRTAVEDGRLRVSITSAGLEFLQHRRPAAVADIQPSAVHGARGH